MSQIVVCGEALMDVFALDDITTGMALEARIGGSPLNVAIGLARLGRPVAFFGAVSTGFLGERLMRALREEGVDTQSVVRVDAPTTLGLVGVDAHGIASYSFYGQGGADRQLHTAHLRGMPASAAALHVGSFAMVVEPIGSTLRALVESVHDRIVVSYDPNVRLNVDPDLVRWRATLDWMLQRAHIVKISEEDLSALSPEISASQFCERALACGVRLVIVTRGAAGAVAATRLARVAVPGITVQIADTVGAGDAFQAALLAWLAENGGFRVDALATLDGPRAVEALHFACTAASLTCSRRGADLPRREDLAPAQAPAVL